MPRLTRRLTLLAGLAALCPGQTTRTPNQLTAAEKRDKWKLLFDGATPRGWRTYNSPEFPSNWWKIQDGCLVAIPGPKDTPNYQRQDLVTVDQFSDFELHWEWKLPPGGNTGLKYLVQEKRHNPDMQREGPEEENRQINRNAIGPEFQLIDDARHADALKKPESRTGSLYNLFPAQGVTMRPMGEWNDAAVIVKGRQVQHFVNGARVLSYELETDDLKARLAKSKWGAQSGFEVKRAGHIALQNHNDEAWFRSLRIRNT